MRDHTILNQRNSIITLLLMLLAPLFTSLSYANELMGSGKLLLVS